MSPRLHQSGPATDDVGMPHPPQGAMLGQQSPPRQPRRITPSEAVELDDALAAGLRVCSDYAGAATSVARTYADRCVRELMAGDLWGALRAASIAVEADRVRAREDHRPGQFEGDGQAVVHQYPTARGA